MSQNHTTHLWMLNKNIQLKSCINQAIKKISNINNHLFILTNSNSLYEGLVEDEDNGPSIELSAIETLKAVDIDSCNGKLYVVTPHGSVLICDESLTILDEITLLEEYKCSQGHNGLNHKVKVKNLAISEYGQLYLSENNQLWASGCMPQIGINCQVPKKVVFFSSRVTYSVAIGVDIAIAVVSKNKTDEPETILDEAFSPVCQICSSFSETLSKPLVSDNEHCPLGVKFTNGNVNCEDSTNEENNLEVASNKDNLLIIKPEKIKYEKNVIFRNTEAAKDFLSRQISRMSSVGEEYLIECTEKPTRMIKENMTNVATFVYEGVRTVGDKVATLSRHVSSGSDCTTGTENNNDVKKNSHEDLMLSGSQSTSERDLSEIEIVEHIDLILDKGINLLNREVWMWGNMKQGFLGNPSFKKDLPIIISSLSNNGVSKISLQSHHVCAITLDGRAFIWGRNNFHQVTLENNLDQMTPKLFVCNMNERVSDAICGNSFTIVLTNKTNVTYFGKDSPSYQTIYHKFMSEESDIQLQFATKPFNSLISSQEYTMFNLAPKCVEHFSNFLVKEQIMLEEMLCVHQYVIRLLGKKTNNSEHGLVYDCLCKSYIDLMYFSAVNVDSLLAYRNGLISLPEVTIIKHFKEFISVYRTYIDVVENIVSINGFLHISKLVTISAHLYTLKSGILKEHNTNEKDISLILLSPVKRTSIYNEFLSYCDADLIKWKEFMDYIGVKVKDAQKTKHFWLNSGKNVDYLMDPKRRVLCDSMTDPINLQSSSRFSSHRFILFSDIFAHINGSTSHLYSLNMIWLELPHHDILHLINVKTPEEVLTLVAPDGVTKNHWYHALQQAIKVALNKIDLYQAPLVRSGSYTFSKNSFFKGSTYTGRWLNAKMHGSGKLKWSDGRSYMGQFSNNFISGYGTMETPNIGIYEGEWKENRQNGYGSFTYCNKDVYKGYFKDGAPHGHGLLRKGSFMANSASLYIGEWVLGKKSGYGVMDDISTGEKYLGCWSDCKKEGSGLIVTSEGTYYEGNFHNNVLSGHGIMVLEDGSHYEGEFKGTGVVGGKGTLTLPTGHTVEGILTGSLEEGIRINTGVLKKKSDPGTPLPKSFGQLCTSPSQKWKALFSQCHQVLGLSEQSSVSSETPRVWQNVAVYLASASTLKRGKREESSLQNSLNNLDVIPPFGRDKITVESYEEIKAYLNRAFESSFHPLGSLLNNLSEAYISSYSGKVHPILVNHAILEIINLTQRVYEIIRYLFPALPICDNECIINPSDDKFEIISYQTLLYPVILPKVYNCLCTLLSLKNDTQEKRYKKVLIEWNKLSDRGLMSLLSVEKKFFNLDQSISLSDKSCAFVEAIETLQQIISVFLPAEKLVIIRSTVEKMTPVAQDLLGDNYVWNMDDLFPLFLYVVVRARIPHLGAELDFMDHFMDRNLENGELGIMFTTLKACYQQILQDKSLFF